MYALRYGTPPIATAVGGLRDTIIALPAEDATGFIFINSTPREFFDVITEAVALWSNNPAGWEDMVRRAMRQSFTWQKSCREYAEVYRKIRLRL